MTRIIINCTNVDSNRNISDIFNFSKDKDFSEGCHLVSVVGNCQPALVLTKEDIELHFNINMIGVRGEKGGGALRTDSWLQTPEAQSSSSCFEPEGWVSIITFSFTFDMIIVI